MNKLDKFLDSVGATGCVICRRDTGQRVPGEVHHIASGSGQRSDWIVACLCPMHHRIGGTSLHGAGVKQFLRMHRLATEYHLMGLVNQYRAEDNEN